MATNFPRVSWRCDRDCNHCLRGPVFNRRSTAIVETGLGGVRIWMYRPVFCDPGPIRGSQAKGLCLRNPGGPSLGSAARCTFQLRESHRSNAALVSRLAPHIGIRRARASGATFVRRKPTRSGLHSRPTAVQYLNGNFVKSPKGRTTPRRNPRRGRPEPGPFLERQIVGCTDRVLARPRTRFHGP
jgi:hypothetical protein